MDGVMSAIINREVVGLVEGSGERSPEALTAAERLHELFDRGGALAQPKGVKAFKLRLGSLERWFTSEDVQWMLDELESALPNAHAPFMSHYMPAFGHWRSSK